MRPHRLELTNQLVLGYGLHEHMTMHAPRKATEEELREFHDADYIDFLKRCVLFASIMVIQSTPFVRLLRIPERHPVAWALWRCDVGSLLR